MRILCNRDAEIRQDQRAEVFGENGMVTLGNVYPNTCMAFTQAGQSKDNMFDDWMYRNAPVKSVLLQRLTLGVARRPMRRR
jgi:hypothetical protein